MITRSVWLDISRDSEASDRRAACELYGLEVGTRVVVYVGERRIAATYIAEQIRQFVDRAHFEVLGSNAASAVWERALRDGPAAWLGGVA